MSYPRTAILNLLYVQFLLSISRNCSSITAKTELLIFFTVTQLVPNQIHEDNLKNIRREARRNKKKHYLKNKINELVTDSKNTNVRDQPRSKLVKDEYI
jgi:hypothetical protein